MSQLKNFQNIDKSPLYIVIFSSSYKVSDKLIKVTYSIPYLKGRALSKLAPNGKVWWTGTSEDLLFGAPSLLSDKKVEEMNVTVIKK